MEVGDVFESPGGKDARFRKGREMRVLSVTTVFGEVWVDAEPVERQLGDEFWHCTYPSSELLAVLALAEAK